MTERKGRKMSILALWILLVAVAMIFRLIALHDARIIELKEADESGVVNYIIPGMTGPSEERFYPYAERMTGAVKLLDFAGCTWDAKHYAEIIAADAQDYKEVRVLGISIGDKVARELVGMVSELEIYDLNPCTNGNQVKPGGILRVTMPLAYVTVVALGPISDIRLIPKDGMWRAWNELVSQAWHIGYDKYGIFPEQTRGIILSKEDQFLINDVLAEEANAAGVPVYWTEGAHVELFFDEPEVYLACLEQMGMLRQ